MRSTDAEEPRAVARGRKGIESVSHRAFRLYAHLTWHTWKRVGCIDAQVAATVPPILASAGKRTGIEVVASATLADHVHALVSFRPDTRLSDFVRLAKSITALVANRRVAGAVKWARGFYAGTLREEDLPRVAGYIRHQYERHPALIPRGPSDPRRRPGVHPTPPATPASDPPSPPLERE